MTVYTATTPYFCTPSFRRVAPSMSEILYGNFKMNKPNTTEVQPTYRLVSDTEGTKTIEIELPGVKKSDMNILVDSENRILNVSGKRFSRVKSVHKEEANDNLQDKEVENKEKKAEENENGEIAEERKPLILYKWRARVNDRVDLSSVEAKYFGEGILQMSLKERKETGPTRIEVNEI